MNQEISVPDPRRADNEQASLSEVPGPDEGQPPTASPSPDAGMDTPSNTPPQGGPAPAPPDPFNPESLRLTQNFLSTGGVKKHVTSVPVRRPTREEWVRVHPSPGFALDTLTMELKDSRECYLIAPVLWDELATEPTVCPRRLHVALNRDGTLFIWPLKLPPADGRQDRWSESALEAAEAAKHNWVRLQADMGLGAYIFYTPIGELPPPQWPDMTLAQALKLAFRNNFIDSRDHLMLRRLRGEV